MPVFVIVCVFVCMCVLPHVYTVVCVMQVCNVCVHLEDQMRTQCVYKGSIYGSTMHVKRTNPMSKMCTCTEDQSYGTVHVVTHTNVYICTVSEVRALYDMYEKPVIRKLNMQACSESSYKKKLDACKNTEETHREQKAWYIKSVACMYKHAKVHAFKLNRMHLYVTMFVSVCTNITQSRLLFATCKK